MATVAPLSALIIGLGGSGAWSVLHVKKQLLDAYGNQIPPNVGLMVLDTAKQSLAKLGSVELEPHEYAHLGGDAYELAKLVATTDQYQHISSWFLADDYLQNLPRAVFALDQGAGQYRQFGRLALFRDVMTTAQSAVSNMLENKITNVALQSSTGSPSISVFIVGSLVGGTGAGLFLDLPHLMQRVAQLRGFQITLRAFLFLTQAFGKTLSAAELEPARPRAFAAMRELSRFLLNRDYKYGYPMHYHGPRAGVEHALWRAENTGKLYDYVYMIDGEGPTRMNAYELRRGSAAVVADAIMSYVDGHYGKHQEQYSANIQAKINNVRQRVGHRAFVGAIGSYSIILPVQQMIQGWSYDLGAEIVGAIVPGSRFDEREYVLELDAAANPERPDVTALDEVERLMTTNAEVMDPHDEDHKRRLSPTPLWRYAYRFYVARQESEVRLVRQLERNELDDWGNIMVPDPLSTDAATRRIIAETRNILEDQFGDHALPSDRRQPKGDPKTDYADIRKLADRFITRQLGPVEAGGSRQGGQYGDALDRFVKFQVDRFSEYVSAYLMNNLNGYDNRDTERAKIGKLGWLLGVLSQWRDVFASVRELLERVREGTSASAMQAKRAEREEMLAYKLREMQNQASETKMFGRDPAIVAQESFIAEVQHYVDFHRTQFMRDAITKTTLRLRDFLEVTIAELEVWADVLALDTTKSLYTQLLNGSRTVRVERQQAEQIMNHQVIDDEAWERERYLRYVEARQARRKLFEAWQWSTDLIPDARGNPTIALSASLAGQELRSDRKGRWHEDNRNTILNFCRGIFQSATEQESVLSYLMEERYNGTPGDLGDDLFENSGYLLGMTDLNQDRIPTNVLLAYHDPTDTSQQGFLTAVLRRLSSRQQVPLEDQDSPLHRVMECSDPFRLTLLSAAELVMLEGITEYIKCKGPYQTLPFDARRQAHIFPAEVHTIEFEERIVKDLNQPRRLLTDRVALLLENETRFMEFLFLLAHNMVLYDQDTENETQVEHLWLLEAPPADERARAKNDMDLWWLTEPSQRPSLLDAMLTYITLSKDIRSFRPNAPMDKPIPYDHILKFLERARAEDTATRIENDELAMNNEQIRRWLEEAFMPPIDEEGNDILDSWTDANEDAFLEFAQLVVRYDILQELATDLENELPRLQRDVDEASNNLDTGEKHDYLTSRLELYDIYSVAVIGLEREIDQIYTALKDRYQHKTHSKEGGRSGITRGSGDDDGPRRRRPRRDR